MPKPVWLVRPRPDGGCDYVNFQSKLEGANPDTIEMREGSHLPPQMPLLKRRHCLPAAEAELRRRALQQDAGFQSSEPLF
ncbi:hypothetical protein KBY58_10980 [Cyanobium sp. HWJ4-Hawea]|uniref:hypothetical protein n=1 Tax=Cyanobium sp. HWJ4-Hawea TaxID=2823713 RepID=UPI0020CBAFFE|nr:hypothetical protein [Cyanobium sp. HWJ4-Hawea]MCP9809958.1 hypothetical protein [Cyanobium sp. HWJ4-Hawea]